MQQQQQAALFPKERAACSRADLILAIFEAFGDSSWFVTTRTLEEVTRQLRHFQVAE